MNTIRYKEYTIYYDPPPIPLRQFDWQFYHDSYDSAEDANDNRCGAAPSVDAAYKAIDQLEEFENESME